jgi:hypothetical protein
VITYEQLDHLVSALAEVLSSEPDNE